MAAHIEGDALITQLKDRLVKMDQALNLLQGLREEPVMPSEDKGLDKIILILQGLREQTADLLEAEISGEDEGVA